MLKAFIIVFFSLIALVMVVVGAVVIIIWMMDRQMMKEEPPKITRISENRFVVEYGKDSSALQNAKDKGR